MHLPSLDCDENVVAGFILPSLIFPDEAVHRQPFFKERDAPVAASLDVDHHAARTGNAAPFQGFL